MEKYISIHGGQYSCIDFNEWKWQNFRAVFLRTYRQPSTVLQTGQRVKVQKFSFSVSKAGSKGMKITRSKAQCFTPALTDDEAPPISWQQKKVNPIGRNSLGVGWFSWYGSIDRKITLNSPRKDVSTSIQLIQISNFIRLFNYGPQQKNNFYKRIRVKATTLMMILRASKKTVI